MIGRTNIYKTSARRNPAALHTRKSRAGKSGRSPRGICPFTLEAIRDCAVRKRSPRTACLFSLEDCLGPR